VVRLVGAVLAEMHDGWQSGERRYLPEGSTALLAPSGDTGTIAAIDRDEEAPRIRPPSPPFHGALPISGALVAAAVAPISRAECRGRQRTQRTWPRWPSALALAHSTAARPLQS
jgi:hypothetical protein